MDPLTIGALAQGGSALLSGILGYFGSKSAANTQADAAKQALALQQQGIQQGLGYQREGLGYQQQGLGTLEGILGQQKDLYSSTQGLLTPYLDLGKGAANTISGLYGFNGQPADYSAFYKSPDYDFAFKEGDRATKNLLSSQGNLLSGSGLTALTNWGQGMASQQYGNYFNRLMSLTGVGQSAAGMGLNNSLGFANAFGNTGRGIADISNAMAGTTNSMANTAVGGANAMGQTAQGIGQAQASGTVGGTNAMTGALTGLGSAANTYASNNMLMNYFNSIQRNNPTSNSQSGYQWPNPAFSPGVGGNSVPYTGSANFWGAGR